MTTSYVTVTPGSDPLSQTTVVTPTYPARQNVSYVTSSPQTEYVTSNRQNVSYVTSSPQTEYVTTTPARTTSRLVTKYVDELLSIEQYHIYIIL